MLWAQVAPLSLLLTIKIVVCRPRRRFFRSRTRRTATTRLKLRQLSATAACPSPAVLHSLKSFAKLAPRPDSACKHCFVFSRVAGTGAQGAKTKDDLTSWSARASCAVSVVGLYRRPHSSAQDASPSQPQPLYQTVVHHLKGRSESD
ncbi:uncharacterized protein C8Q71DRAFT_46412 [Rhodofomes roseus]|uniref:Secreted protein n=1 Tax=Rhodofomes roseus TaxID=34475 RepID=A0ABQ8KGG9_9APHY|nr:uncharacterized protein C8Q71DRAFT_46412 [Rhodofomes roseus]KAH9836522.1 hypothetical protein C8Q71DRAFT_46412 [Rhodofomes roseus]